jgi:hypothetical protein
MTSRTNSGKVRGLAGRQNRPKNPSAATANPSGRPLLFATHHFGRADEARRHHADGRDALSFSRNSVVQTAR